MNETPSPREQSVPTGHAALRTALDQAEADLLIHAISYHINPLHGNYFLCNICQAESKESNRAIIHTRGCSLASIKAAKQSQEEAGRTVGDLLAVIHGDGGHYQAEHGFEKAYDDAVQKIAADRAEDTKMLEWLEGMQQVVINLYDDLHHHWVIETSDGRAGGGAAAPTLRDVLRAAMKE